MFFVPLYVYPGCAKDAMVADLWNCFREEGGWSPTFLRSFDD